ncbi:hypothetical protein JCGZ_22880 [Jatropha curcas]|uniref:Ubiquitin-like domain-containing protein n=1 Tax=Jatropha curcas TaxID=180498 RepID=A0A067K0S1_JATCU|nr:hypothetical protein JCGZ_22880 [Jatropha curcas]
MEDEQVTFLIDGEEAEVKPLISMSRNATIGQLKEKIEELTGISVCRQTLFHNNSRLFDFCTIKRYKFGSIAGVVLEVAPVRDQSDVNITVTCPNFKINVKVNPNKETVFQLKEKIGKIWGIHSNDITLWRLSRKMQDHHKLFKYYVIEGSDVQFTRVGEPLMF